jgi:hypothetical protein
MLQINRAFECVKFMSEKWKIDESHALKHSMDVYKFAQDIYKLEKDKTAILKDQWTVIGLSAILHDMCDKKYMNEADGVEDIRLFMDNAVSKAEMDMIINIITTMSYSKVKKNGYPDFGEYMMAYHIVREADLLAAYDIDRCIIFGMMVDGLEYSEAVIRATKLFSERVLNYRSDGLFVTEFSIQKSAELHDWALQR